MLATNAYITNKVCPVVRFGQANALKTPMTDSCSRWGYDGRSILNISSDIDGMHEHLRRVIYEHSVYRV